MANFAPIQQAQLVLEFRLKMAQEYQTGFDTDLLKTFSMYMVLASISKVLPAPMFSLRVLLACPPTPYKKSF